LLLLRQSGTKLVVVSNSMPFFVPIVMQAAFADKWHALFDLVIARSLKPGFFAPSGTQSASFLHPETQTPLCLSSCGLSMVCGGNDVELLDFVNPKDASGGSRAALFIGDSVTHDVIAPSCTGWDWKQNHVATRSFCQRMVSPACNFSTLISFIIF
jgi:hypothetical protein